MITAIIAALCLHHAGTSLGNKAMEIAEKVVTDAAQELKKDMEDYDGGSLPGKLSGLIMYGHGRKSFSNLCC